MRLVTGLIAAVLALIAPAAAMFRASLVKQRSLQGAKLHAPSEVQLQSTGRADRLFLTGSAEYGMAQAGGKGLGLPGRF